MSRFRQLFWPLVFLLCVALGALLLDGGYAHYEGQFFLVNYLDTRELFAKIFSAHFNEWDCYQGRELSFLFGWLDAEAIRYSARLGWIHLYSLTHFIALFAMAVVLWDALLRLFPALERRNAALILVLLLTSPAAIFSGYYYRPAKILAAFFLAVVVAVIARIRERNWSFSATLLIALGLAGTLMGMSDRLGIYMLMLLAIVIVAARRFDRASFIVAATLAVSLVINAVWSALIGPRLSAIADGYRPDTADQVVHLRFTFLRLEHYGPALSLLADHVEYFFGNFGLFSLIGLVCVTAAVLWRARDRRVALTFAIVALAAAAVYVAMYARLTSLPWPASRRVYYWLPQLVVLAIGGALIADRSRRVFPGSARSATLLLVVMIGGNILSLPRHREAIRSQEHKRWIVQAPAVRKCIRERVRPVSEFRLDAPYAQLCGSLRAAVLGVKWNGHPAAYPSAQLYCRGTDRARETKRRHSAAVEVAPPGLDREAQASDRTQEENKTAAFSRR